MRVSLHIYDPKEAGFDIDSRLVCKNGKICWVFNGVL